MASKLNPLNKALLNKAHVKMNAEGFVYSLFLLHFSSILRPTTSHCLHLNEGRDSLILPPRAALGAVGAGGHFGPKVKGLEFS